MDRDEKDSKSQEKSPESTSASESVLGWRGFLNEDLQLITGFFGWYIVNIAIWYIVLGGFKWTGGDGSILIIFIFPLNILMLIIFSLIKPTRKIGFGILIALASNLVISLVIGMFFNGICFVPFFIDANL